MGKILNFVSNQETHVNERIAHLPNLKPHLVSDLQRILHEVNPYVKELKTALETMPEVNTHKVVINPDKIPAGEHRGPF